ncbi:MAG TPA: pitrilysin family protein [Saprospiraceae bacterium]
MSESVEAPLIREIKELPLPSYETKELSNGMNLFMIKGGTEPVMRMEMVFRAGATFEHKAGVAEVMAGLMSEGTITMTSAVLAEKIESLGATMFTRGGVDTARIRLLTLSRFFPELIEIVREVMHYPAFDPSELKVYTDNKIERLKIDLKKNEVLAYRHLTEAIFGPKHPYGKNIFPEDYLSITPDDLRQHHKQNIIPQKGIILVSGSFGDAETSLIEQVLGQWRPDHSNGTEAIPSFLAESKTGYFEIDGPQVHQAAIRIGSKLFPQTHPDFNGLFVLNTILGGYFGSRLMMEIRENQGLTYGIYSSVDSFASDGCFYISTETATTNTEKVIEAIGKEVRKLKEELIPEAELQMARNYLMGHLMTQIDGPFSTMDLIKSLKIEHLEDRSFADLVRTIQQITSSQLRELAIKYLDLEKWVTIVVK